MFVSRVEERPRTEIWPIELSSPLPVVGIPLLADDADVSLDLQQAFSTIYDLLGYGFEMDYGSEAEVPLMGNSRRGPTSGCEWRVCGQTSDAALGPRLEVARALPASTLSTAESYRSGRKLCVIKAGATRPIKVVNELQRAAAAEPVRFPPSSAECR